MVQCIHTCVYLPSKALYENKIQKLENAKFDNGNWIGVKFATPKHPKSALIRQRADSFSPANICPKIAMNISEMDLKDIRTAAIADMPSDSAMATIALKDVDMGRYWRVRQIGSSRSGDWDLVTFNLSMENIQLSGGGPICSEPATKNLPAINAFEQKIGTPWVAKAAGIKFQVKLGLAGTLERTIAKKFHVSRYNNGMAVAKPNTVESLTPSK